MVLPGFIKRLKPDRGAARSDLMAGVVLGIESVPDALASGVLAGVNPLYALYGVMLGTPVGAIFSGSVYLSVATTSAIAVPEGGPPPRRRPAPSPASQRSPQAAPPVRSSPFRC
jgi:hypothetical protein